MRSIRQDRRPHRIHGRVDRRHAEHCQVVIALAPSTFSIDVGGKTTTTWKRSDAVFIGRGEPHQAQSTSGKPQDFVIVAIK